MAVLDDKETLLLAQTLCEQLQSDNVETLAQAQERGDVRETLATEIASAKRLFSKQRTRSPHLFDIAAEHLLVEGQSAKTLPAAAAMRNFDNVVPATPEHYFQAIQEAVRLVKLQAESVDGTRLIFVASLMECPSVSARITLSWQTNVDAHLKNLECQLIGGLPGECAISARLKAQPSRFSLHRFGELEIGVKEIDDAYIIDAKTDATAMLRQMANPLLRVAAHLGVLQWEPSSLRFLLIGLPPNPKLAAEIVDATLDLWAATVSWCLSLQ